MNDEANQLADALEQMLRSEPSDKVAHASWVKCTCGPVYAMIQRLYEEKKLPPIPVSVFDYFSTCDLHLEVPSLRDNECMELVIQGLRSGVVPTEGELKSRHNADRNAKKERGSRKGAWWRRMLRQSDVSPEGRDTTHRASTEGD